MQRHKIHKQKGETKMSWFMILTTNKKKMLKSLNKIKRDELNE